MLIGPEPPRVRFRSLVAALEAAAESEVARDGIVLVDRHEHDHFHPWSEITSRAERSAASLARAGVKPGDRVAMVLPTSLGFMDAFFGALFAGAVPVPLYPPVRLGRLPEYEAATLRMLEVVGARALIVDARTRSVLGPILAASGAVRVDVETLAACDARLVHDPGEQELGLIQFSSGSTVDPKAVSLTHGQLLAQCAALESLMRRTVGDTRVGCSWLPLYHDMGLIGCLLVAVCYPGRLVLLAPEHFLAKPAAWLRAVSRHRAFISPAPNFAYAVCAKRVRDEELAGVDLSCWRLALNGAEPVLQTTLDAFADRFSICGFDRRALMPVYGLSEAALAVTFAPPGRDAVAIRFGSREVLSVGRPVPGFSVRVVDDAGRERPDGEEGRIEARGPSVMHGYFGDRAGTARALREAWLDTGDLGFARGGELYVTGRAKDLVIVRGQNHMPQEFEEPLFDIPGLRAGCAVALGETFADGEGLLILAELAQNDTRDEGALERDIVQRVLERTGVRPHTVRLLAPGTLPRTSSGKLRRSEALRAFRAGTLVAPRKVTPWLLLGAMARSRWSMARALFRRRVAP